MNMSRLVMNNCQALIITRLWKNIFPELPHTLIVLEMSRLSYVNFDFTKLINLRSLTLIDCDL